MADVPFPSTPERTQEGKGEAIAHQLHTRTIAILAGVACKTHRLAIQTRITQNGFAILSERLEEWSLDSDEDFLSEFLREEEQRVAWMHRLTGAPIYVMVLERHRAVEMWQEMCGADLDEDEEGGVDDDGLPIQRTGLRARYGAGALYASSVKGAPRQIAICFPDLASLQAMEALHAEENVPNRYAAVGSDGGFLVREDEDIVYDEEGKAFDAHNGEPLELQQELVASVQSSSSPAVPRVFKARPMPSSTQKASIKPRLSKAAALRMGVALPEPPKRTLSNTSSNDAALGISGLPRVGVTLPKSLMAPSVAPRMNRVAAARTKTASSPEQPNVVKERRPIDYSNTPGHKRQSMSSSRPASLAAPTVAPRLNKAAAARLADKSGGSRGEHSNASASLRPERTRSNETVEPASAASRSPTAVRKPVDFSNTPGHKRASQSSSGIKSLQAPLLAPRSNRVSESRQPSSPPKAARNRTSSSVEQGGKENLGGVERRAIDYSNTPGHKRASNSFSIASLAQPVIAPRSNASAAKRLSMGGVHAGLPIKAVGQPAKDAALPLPRSSSAMGSTTPSKQSTIARSAQGSRPTSRASMSGAHQDGAYPRAVRPGAAPPSSFRM